MNTNKGLTLLMILALTIFSAIIVYAESNQPLGAQNVTVIKSETSNLSLYNPDTVNAEAGNVTELTITGVTQTKTWQGYYGNVSGTITLEDAQGNRFYDWTAAEPQGEVYASVNNTITWSDVNCAPISNSGYISTWNTYYGITSSDYDSINLTYNDTDHPTFYAGTTTLTGCPTTYTFINNASQQTDFPGVLLTSDANGTMIFTSIIEDDTTGVHAGITGFDGAVHDFQMLVAENGQNGNDVVTPYYFWVEIQ